MSSDGARALRIQILIGLMCLALLTYFVLLGRTAVELIASGELAAVGLGAAVDYLAGIGMDKIAAHEQAITEYAVKRLLEVPEAAREALNHATHAVFVACVPIAAVILVLSVLLPQHELKTTRP